MRYTGPLSEYFELEAVDSFRNIDRRERPEGLLSCIWFLDDQNQINIDGYDYEFQQNEMIFLTGFHQVKIEQTGRLRVLRFNSPFYCILDHDSEVGCKGLLFFGSSQVPHLRPRSQDLEIMETVWSMIEIEMKTSDRLQLEMLQMMLKRWLILCTRILKSQDNYTQISNSQVDVVREYNFLVEQYFREKHTVAEYAELLHKSPKTLSNLFKKVHDKSPLTVLQDRIQVEARRLITHTEQSISEIAYSLGYNDIQSFSRFFKKREQMSPSEFRSAHQAA